MPAATQDFLTAKQVAELWGTSHDEVDRAIKAGLPHKKLKIKGAIGNPIQIRVKPEDARLWAVSHRQTGYRKSKLARAMAQPLDPLKYDKTEGLDGSVNRLRSVELDLFGRFLKARESGEILHESALIALYVDACKALKALEAIQDERATLEKLIWSEIKMQLMQWAEPIRALLDGLPRNLAARANPTDPATAEAVIRGALVEQVLPMMARAARRENEDGCESQN